MNNNQTEFFFYPKLGKDEPRVVIAGVYNPETRQIRIAKSECSIKDTFNKAKGRAIALGRARCSRELSVKFYMRDNKKIVRSNAYLLPRTFTLSPVTEEKETALINQFIQIAKSL